MLRVKNDKARINQSWNCDKLICKRNNEEGLEYNKANFRLNSLKPNMAL